MSVLPWRARCDRMIADPHRANAAGIVTAERMITIADQVPGSFIPRKGFGYLSGDPLRGRVGSDTDTGQPSPAVLKDHQAIEELERNGSHHEEVERCDTGCMIAQEGLPALRSRSPGTRYILGYGRLRDLDPQ